MIPDGLPNLVKRLDIENALAEVWHKNGGWEGVESGLVNMTGLMADRIMSLYRDEAATRISALEGERDEALRIAKAVSRALTGLTSGGSEYHSHSKLLDVYFADIEACVGAVRERYDSGHKAKLDRVDLQTSLDAAREALKPFAEAGGMVPLTHGPSNEPVSDDEPVSMSCVGFYIGDVTVADLERARAVSKSGGET